MDTGKFTAGVNPAMDFHPIQGGVEILLVASCYRSLMGQNSVGDGTLVLIHWPAALFNKDKKI